MPSLHQPTARELYRQFRSGELTGPQLHSAIRYARRNSDYRLESRSYDHLTPNIYGVRTVLVKEDRPMTAAEIHEKLGGARSSVNQALRTLYFGDEVVRSGEGTRRIPYCYELADE